LRIQGVRIGLEQLWRTLIQRLQKFLQQRQLQKEIRDDLVALENHCAWVQTFSGLDF
jgi:hypothetical protein